MQNYIKDVSENNSSYADKVKENKKVDSNTMKKEFKTNIDPVKLEIGITNVKTTKDVFMWKNNEIDKHRNEMVSRLGNDYEVREIHKTRPKIKIMSLDEEIGKEGVSRRIWHKSGIFDEKKRTILM